MCGILFCFMDDRLIGIALLGSTGSIGTQTLDIARRFPDRIKVVALAAHNSTELLKSQINLKPLNQMKKFI